MKKHHVISLLLALAVAVGLCGAEALRARFYLQAPTAVSATGLEHVGFLVAASLQRLEWALYDARFKWRGPRAPHPDIAIIAIEDQDLKEIGQWPWSRGLHAQLIRTLEKAPPKALLFDIFFIDPYTADPKGDKALAQATAANPWVVHSMFFKLNPADQVVGFDRPMDTLSDALRAVGYTNAVIDEDGTTPSGTSGFSRRKSFDSAAFGRGRQFIRRPPVGCGGADAAARFAGAHLDQLRRSRLVLSLLPLRRCARGPRAAGDVP